MIVPCNLGMPRKFNVSSMLSLKYCTETFLCYNSDNFSPCRMVAVVALNRVPYTQLTFSIEIASVTFFT